MCVLIGLTAPINYCRNLGILNSGVVFKTIHTNSYTFAMSGLAVVEYTGSLSYTQCMVL